MTQKDEFVSGLERLLAWAEANRRSIVVGIVSVLVVVVVVAGSLAIVRGRGERADQALGLAMGLMQAPVLTGGELPLLTEEASFTSDAERDAAVLTALDSLLSSYPNSRAAATGGFLRGLTLHRLDRTDEAHADLEAFLAEHAGSALAPRARRALAMMELQSGAGEVAVSRFQELVDAPAAFLPVDQSLMDLGRAQEAAGLTDAAAETYRRLVNEHPQSVFSSEATQALIRLQPVVPAAS